MNDQELFEEARDRILDVMTLLADKGAKDTQLALCAMLVPILHCAHDCAPNANAVRQMINSSNKLAKQMSEGANEKPPVKNYR